MPSLSSILSIATSGLRTYQEAMNVTAHNLSNASTDGYSRQQVVISGNTPLDLPQGVFGTGVHTADVRSLRDGLLDAAYFQELTAANEHETRSAMLGRIESTLGEPSDLGLDAALDAFYSAWSELSTNPTNATARTLVRQTASTLATRLHNVSDGLDSIRQEVDTRVQDSADRINALLDKVASLNSQIVSYEADGTTAGDLRDERGRALEELSQMIPIQTVERTNGGMGVILSGIGIVDGAYAHHVEVRTSAGTVGLGIVGSTGLVPDMSGSVGGLLDVLNTDLPGIRAQLDDLAGALVTEVNAIHVTGTAPNGATGIDFFDPAGVTASSIDLSAAVQADVQAIAAGTPDGVGAYRAGANDVALALAGLRDTTLPALGGSTRSFYQQLVSDLGQSVLSSTEAAEAQRALSDQAEVRRMETSGVSVDEELVMMIEFQRAYQASARTISAADEMIQSLLAI